MSRESMSEVTGNATGDATGAGPGVHRFRRSRGRVVMDLAVTPVGAILFLGFAALLLLGTIDFPPPARILGAVMFGFFGIMMAIASLVTMRRGVSRTILEVSPSGLWTPEMGRLTWGEIVEVRLESFRGPGAVTPTTRYLALGIVPRDPAKRRGTAMSAGSALAGAYAGFLHRLDPSIRIGASRLAPFTVAEYELERPILEVVRAVSLYCPVRFPDLGPDGFPPSTATGPVARPVGGAPGAGSASLLDAPTAAGPAIRRPDAGPAAAFHRPTPNVLRLVRVGMGIVLAGVFIWVALSSVARTGGGWFGLVVLALGITFVVIGLRSAWVTLSPYRTGRAETLRIGPDGITTPELGRLPWDRVREIATERAPVMYDSHERWRLVIVPEPGARTGERFVVAADDLDRPFDDVLRLIRTYHTVVERA